ncbi:DDRGK domain-containing protein 1 [Brachyhypopomus gauderio]|uniref:DDRGK domain-containing protein 1 n=1 Tax=Brachyhypopomus gauderio TaxID=698409 RepID=UPI00404344EB
MDIILYFVAAAILIVLIVFAAKIRSRTEEADHEDRRNVAARAAAAPRAPEERGTGMPRRRRGLDRMMAQRRAQRDDENEIIGADEVDEDEEGEMPPADERPQAPGKVGAKKQRKLEEKQARKAQREAELEEREERRRMQELREQEKKKEEEKERLLEQKQEEELQRAKEEQEKREEEEYQRLKESFVIEEQGETEELTEQESRNLLQEFIQYVKDSKVVLLEDLASHFGLRTQDAIARLQDLMADHSLTGVIDDRGKFIFITPQELDAVAQFIKQRGRVSISELAQASNTLISLTPAVQNISLPTAQTLAQETAAS